jgi:peroxiredoxin
MFAYYEWMQLYTDVAQSPFCAGYIISNGYPKRNTPGCGLESTYADKLDRFACINKMNIHIATDQIYTQRRPRLIFYIIPAI